MESGKLAAGIRGNFRVHGEGRRDQAFILPDTFETQHLAGEEEGIALHQLLKEIFLDLAERHAAAPDRALGIALDHADIQFRRLDDGAEVEAILLRDRRIGDAPATVLHLADAGVTLIGAQRITAGGGEIHHPVEGGPRQIGIGRGAGHFAIEIVRIEGLGAGHAEHMLGENIERALGNRRRILRADIIGIKGCPALHHLETVGGNEDRL